MEPHWQSERAQLPRNIIENTMFEEEPDAVDLAKDSRLHPLEPDEIEYEPHSSRLLVRGFNEHDLDEDEEDYESSVRLLGKSFMNRSSNHRNNLSGMYNRDSCSLPISRTFIVGAFVIVIILSISMVVYFLPKCTFTKEGCHKSNMTSTLIYPLATNGQVFPWPKMRLPKAVVPIHYDLTLHPNLTTLNFTGSVHITLRIMEDTNNITLHSSDLEITTATITPEGTSHPKNVQVLEYPPHKQIAIKFNPMLTKEEKYVLNLKYSANLSESSTGFFKGTYQDQNKTRILAATQFEPFFARSAFPCFDEPAFKATFRIRIIREAGYISLSNMPKDNTTAVADGLYQDNFMKSVKMSTYLVAFVVADLTSINHTTTGGTQVSVYAVPGKTDQMKYPLGVAMKLINFFESFFNISSSLKKLDLVALPGFQREVMENWGLIIGQEMALLCKEETASAMAKLTVAYMIAHELAHQWIGNLVTMEWWNDLWLNEGLATFMEEFSLEKVFPELQLDETDFYSHFRLMEKDSMNSTHPLLTPVETLEQIEEMFDFISYHKGSSILLMLKDFLNETIFQQRFRQYLQKHQYQNSTIEDFWNSMSEVGNVDLNVKEIMETWTRQTGYPVVTVKLDTTTNKIHLNQTRFLRPSHPLNSSSSYCSHLWHIPLTYITSSCADYKQPKCIKKWLLKDKTDTIDLKDPNVAWVKFNINHNGYYIVEYDESSTEKIMGLLQTNHEALSEHDRADFINNAFLLASVGKMSIKKVLNLTSYLKQEASTMPISESLYQLYNIYQLVQIRGEFKISNWIKDYIFDIFGHLIDQQTWSNNGSISERQLRSQLLTVACDLNYDTCVQNASNLFSNWMNSSDYSVLPSDLTETIFSVGARTVEGWTFMCRMYNHLQSGVDHRKMLRAMAKTNNTEHLLWLMYNSLNHDTIRIQELPYILADSCSSLVGCLLAWDFVKENWEELIKKFDLGLFDFHIIVIETASKFSTKTHLLEVQAFFDSLTDKSSQSEFIQKALDRIQLNIQWMEANLKSLEKQ
ncbi:leucyl-cystinyl aminopeptidase-like isoform X1 [Hypanus sabinus]|uniref:leucyl-cystinyl aminopeptidase-like isoform X1 n=2 Tax=Hypanus sabinus TaxID=79690 RepID=UPI0028C44444|nr:leucyl-cystinyl aminopeptidase-like isoform X1 [Hypanus sabinus]